MPKSIYPAKSANGRANLHHMRIEYEALMEAGLLEPDEPHPYIHALHVQAAERDFSPQERRRIRMMLDMKTAF